MEDPHRAQLTQYVQQAYQSGASIEAIRAGLLRNGWRRDMVEPILAEFQAAIKPVDPHRTRNAILWIVGPLAALTLTALLQLVVRFFWVSVDDMGVIGIFRIVINMLSIIVGMAAVPMMIIGPIIGIVKLSKK